MPNPVEEFIDLSFKYMELVERNAKTRARYGFVSALAEKYEEDTLKNWIEAGNKAKRLYAETSKPQLYNSLASISLIAQRNDSPAHVLLEHIGKVARDALKPQ